MEPVDLIAAYKAVTERIRHAIHIGIYLPGAKLPPERTLAQVLGVSRTTVREAIRVLEAEGYLVSKRGATGGITVLDQGKDEDRIRPLLLQRMPELEQAFEYRIAVEGRVAYLAAERRTKQDLVVLRTIYAQLESELETTRFRTADTSFHLAVADAARNLFMRRAIEEVRATTWTPIDRLISKVFSSANEHHLQILEAIENKEPDAAEQAAIAHIERAFHDLQRAVGEIVPGGVRSAV